MDRIPSSRELTIAGRACVIMAYAGGLAGIAAGTLLLRDDELAFAVIIWTLTFAVGAVLMAVSLIIRALSGLAAQIGRVDADVRLLAEDHARSLPPRDAGRDPWLRH